MFIILDLYESCRVCELRKQSLNFLKVKKHAIGRLKFLQHFLLVLLSSFVLDCFGGKMATS